MCVVGTLLKIKYKLDIKIPLSLNTEHIQYLLNHFKSITNDLPSSNVYQVAMDRPNVNSEFYKKILRLYKEESCHFLIDIDTCSHCTVHNSFRTRVEATSWNVNNSPAPSCLS